MEVLVRTVDKGVAVDCSKRGDVITVCPDGWAWSAAERTNPDWRIISAPILQITAESFLAKSEVIGVMRRREWYVDFTLLPNPALFTGARTQAIITLTKKQLTDATVKKL